MALRINYIGPADVRVIPRQDILDQGLSDPGRDLIWKKTNNFALDVPPDVALFLLALGEFGSAEDLDFASALNEGFGGRALGVAELHQNITSATATGASPLIIPGFQLEVEAIGKPIEVKINGLFSTTGAAQGVQVILYEDGTGIHLAFPIAAVTGQATALSLSRFRNPSPGLHLYTVGVARYTSGTLTVTGASSVPATLSAVEL